MSFRLKSRDYLDTPERKRFFNREHFTAAAARYDLATIAMSLGRDSAWKRTLIAALPERPAPLCLDLACGTGDICFLLAGRYPEAKILGIDLTEEMLQIARRRNRSQGVQFLCCDMNQVPLPDASVDFITGSYALRNAPDLPQALGEIRRLLKDDGVAAFLDFSKPTSPRLQKLQGRLLRTWCGLWGRILSGSFSVHGYIADSLADYPDRERFAQLLREQGFAPLRRKRLFGGMLELTVVKKGKSDW